MLIKKHTVVKINDFEFFYNTRQYQLLSEINRWRMIPIMFFFNYNIFDY